MNRVVVGTLVGVVALAAGIGTTHAWDQLQSRGEKAATRTAEPHTSPSTPVEIEPTAPTDAVPVAFNINEVYDSFTRPGDLPGCGDRWGLSPIAKHNISIEVVRADDADEGAGASRYAFSGEFTNNGSANETFFGSFYEIIVVQDGIVIGAGESEFFSIDVISLDPGETSDSFGFMPFDGTSTCEGQRRINELLSEFDAVEGTQAERDAAFEEYLAERDALEALEPGEYEVYAWSPVVFGPHAAAAQILIEEGYEDPSVLRTMFRGNPILEESPIADLCPSYDPTADDTWMFQDCQWLTDDDFDEALMRDVPAESVKDLDPFFVISEPYTFTVE